MVLEKSESERRLTVATGAPIRRLEALLQQRALKPETLKKAAREAVAWAEGYRRRHAGLVDAARKVIERWEKGDLAEAVRGLDELVRLEDVEAGRLRVLPS